MMIDAFEPLALHQPATVAELCDLVKDAAKNSQAIYPIGGKTAVDIGFPPTKPGSAIDMTKLDGVIDYPATDMTITVQAGITIDKLRKTLAAEGQWLPVDVPLPAQSTLGGAIALNISGPRRLGFGTLRDYIIGISFVTDEGEEVKAGGRVVKNVAGYDLMKLQTGAVGTLGPITQVTLKVRPRPGASMLVAFTCNNARLEAILDLLHDSTSRPIAVELFNRTASRLLGMADSLPKDDWTIVVGFEENSATVEWQVGILLQQIQSSGVREIKQMRDSEAIGLWLAMGDLARSSSSSFIWKINLPPSQVASFLSPFASNRDQFIQSEAMNGIIWLHSDGLIGDHRDIESRIESFRGNFTIIRCPLAAKKSLPIWGRPGADRELMRHVKRTLDPKNVFNPGRLFGE